MATGSGVTDDLLEGVRLLTHASVRIESRGGFVVYIDPYDLRDEPHDADLILVTHDHFDHLSPDDIAKVAGKPGCKLVVPASVADAQGDELGQGFSGLDLVPLAAGQTLDGFADGGLVVEALPAYNVGKRFHPQESGWLGYVVTVDGRRIFHMGDTDQNPDNEGVACDVLFIPCGGTYTMDVPAAASCALVIKPKLVVPMHYGSVAGAEEDGESLARLVAQLQEGADDPVLVAVIKEY